MILFCLTSTLDTGSHTVLQDRMSKADSIYWDQKEIHLCNIVSSFSPVK